MGSPWAMPKTKNFFFQKLQNQILSFQNLFILTKYHMFWLSYECFLYCVMLFLLKSAISSHSSCVISCEGVYLLGFTLIVYWGDFSCCFGVTLIEFLVWYTVKWGEVDRFWHLLKHNSRSTALISPFL